jgi:hypothetical protein
LVFSFDGRHPGFPNFFLAGILLFGVVAWSLSAKKQVTHLLPMLIPVSFIYRLLKKPNQHQDLEVVLKERGLS